MRRASSKTDSNKPKPDDARIAVKSDKDSSKVSEETGQKLWENSF